MTLSPLLAMFFISSMLFLLGAPLSAQDGVGSEEPYYTLYLIGDAGEPDVAESASMRLFKKTLGAAKAESAAVFLGDNIYPRGLPDISHLQYALAKSSIDGQLDALEGYKGRPYFIPGNHDWDKGHKGGRRKVNLQETYVESSLGGKNVFLPDDACPGPVEVQLHEEITLIIIDSQWLLHPWDKPNEEEGSCSARTVAEVYQQLDDLIRKNKDKNIVVVSHHPMLTYGIHGGVSSIRDHLFPLSRLKKSLLVPLPVIGSIYPLFRKYIGNVQDTSHPKYKTMKDVLMSSFAQHPGLIHAAGHEHALQYTEQDSVHYIVSGAGVKTTPVKPGKNAELAVSLTGFAQVDFYPKGKVHLSFFTPEKESGDAVLLFEKVLRQKVSAPSAVSTVPSELPLDFGDSTVLTAASERYGASKQKEYVFGSNYRASWSQPINVPVFDIGKEKGGLEIVQRGGGMQTKSLRLENKQGKQYVLRSIEKYPENAVPKILRKTFAQDIVQDQISAAHPYGAFVIPPLAEAAGIYHTNPELVYIPDDPRFFQYREDFAGTLALFEERPAKDRSDIASFGRSEKIVNTTKVLKRIRQDNDNYVDQQSALRSRLFDLLIGDWDRHDDQWRWASFDEGKGKVYRPIPRDRDQAFFVNEGVFPKVWSRKWALPKFEGFHHEVRFPSGLMFNARYFDRSFLTEPELEDWVNTAKSIKESVSDSIIENAIKKWPKEIYALDGEEVIAKLKSRRDRLDTYAQEHYLYLSKAVDVLGSDKREHFDVQRMANGDLKVKVVKISKKGNKKQTLYQRHFKIAETKEVRLWGREGEDVFHIHGEGKKGIKVRIIGGEGEDELNDESRVKGFSKKTLFYDTKKRNSIHCGGECIDKRSKNPEVNHYDRKAFKYNVFAPLVTGNFNPDDGIFIGGGFLGTTHGFRKSPFKSQHRVLGSYAFNTSSYNFLYHGEFVDAVGKWRLDLALDVKAPNYVNNFFGFGNETNFDRNADRNTGITINRPIQFYRLRFTETVSCIKLVRTIGESGQFSFGHQYQFVEIDDPEQDLFIRRFDEATPGRDIENRKHFTGGSVRLDFDTRRSESKNFMGTVWENELLFLAGLDKDAISYAAYNTSLAFYHSFRLPAKLTFATRFGMGLNIGEYEFFQAQTLGGRQELRGFRKTRFYGDQKAYNNTEVRLQLFNLRTYLFPASFGLLVFHDVGRVWYENESGIDPSATDGKSNRWHQGYGGGLWLRPFNMATLSMEVGASEEETLFYVRLGFLF